MAEGLTVIAAGIVVVLCIMASMFLFIELILKFDQLLRVRAERTSSPEAVEPADPEASRAPERGCRRGPGTHPLGILGTPANHERETTRDHPSQLRRGQREERGG
jgi:hypothetical protein